MGSLLHAALGRSGGSPSIPVIVYHPGCRFCESASDSA
jgi:hypothetical protein